MKNKQQQNTTTKHNNMTKIWIIIHPNFLQEFDTQIQNNYTSRNEAIRHAIKLVLKEITQYKTQKHQTTTNTTTNTNPLNLLTGENIVQ